MRFKFLQRKMNEGRRSQVVLLDERRLDILIQPKLFSGELLDMVASHFNLKEKEYFGLAFQDETGHYSWLQLDKRVLEHDLPKKPAQGVLILYFLVKYYVESITLLRDSATVEAFYLQAKQLIAKGTLEVDSDTVFHLAALVLQGTHGDYVDDQTTRSQLKKLPVLPTSALKEHPSLTVCEDRVIEHYKTLAGQCRGSAIVSYMNIVENLPTYGIHFYEVKDKSGIPWWVGLSYKGISQYDHTDRKVPRKFFQWKLLENLYFRDRKFSIEVHHPRRVSVSRRTFGPGNVTVIVWFAATPSLTKCIWSMAIAQHQFYLDHRHSKSQHLGNRSLGQIAAELSRSTQSLSSGSSGSNLSRSASSHSLPAIKIEEEQSEESKAAKREMLAALRARKEALEDALRKKTEELKSICLREGELTGEVPPEIPLKAGEKIPQIRRRVGTAFTLSDKLLLKAKAEEEALAKLELEYEIQGKIASAALRLANDTAANKSVRRQRKLTYQQAHEKFKIIEQKLVNLRKQADASKKKISRQPSDDEPSEDNISQSTTGSDAVFHESENASDASPTTSPKSSRYTSTVEREPSHTPSPAPTSSSSSSIHQSGLPSTSVSAPPSPTKHRQQHRLLSPISSTSPGTGYGPGYVQNSVYQTRTSYRRQQYPTLTTSSQSGGSDYDNVSSSGSGSLLSLRSPYKNRFESSLNIEGSNLYSVPTQRTSQAFDSQDDILASPPPEPQDLGLVSRHNSLESNRRHHRVSSNVHCKPPPVPAVSVTAPSSEELEPGSIRDSSSRHQNGLESWHPVTSNSHHLHHGHQVFTNMQLNHEMSHSRHTYAPPHVHQPFCTASPSQQKRAISVSVSYPEGFTCSQRDLHLFNTPGVPSQLPSYVESLSRRECVSQQSYSSELQSQGALTHPSSPIAYLENSTNSLHCEQSRPYATSNPQEPGLQTNQECNSHQTGDEVTVAHKPPLVHHHHPHHHHHHHHFHHKKQNRPHGVQEPCNRESLSPTGTILRPSPSPCEFSGDAVDGLNHPSALRAAATDVFLSQPTSPSFSGTSKPTMLEALQEGFRSPIPYNQYLTVGIPTSKTFSSFSASVETLSSPTSKQKTKDWVETSLDSPLPNRKSKTKERKQSSSSLVNNNSCLSSGNQSLETSTLQNRPMSPLQVKVDLLDSSCPSPSPGTASDQGTHMRLSSQSSVGSLVSPTNSYQQPGVEVNIVTMGRFQPYWEETKPYEMADFYKYSTKHRKGTPSNFQDIVGPSESQITRTDDGVTKVNIKHMVPTAVVSPTVISTSESWAREHNTASPVTNVSFLENHTPMVSPLSSDEAEPLPEVQANESVPSTDISINLDSSGPQLSLADAFHEEMLAWYEDQEAGKKATLV